MSGQVNWNALFTMPNPGVAFSDAFQKARKQRAEDERLAEDRAWQRQERSRKRAEWGRDDAFRGATTDILLGGGAAPNGAPVNALMQGANPTRATGTIANPAQPTMDDQPTGTAPLAPQPPQQQPGAMTARERMIRANPEGYLTFQGKQVDLTADQIKNASETHNMAMQLLGGVSDQPSYEAAKQQARQIYSRFGEGGGSFIDTLPAQYSPEVVRRLQLQGMKTSEQFGAIIRENRLEWDIEDDKLDNAEVRRSHDLTHQRGVRGQDLTHSRASSRGGRTPAAKAPTPTSVVGRIMEKQSRGEPLTPAERQTLQEYRAGKGSSKPKRSGGDAADRIGPVYQRGGKRIQYSKGKGGYVDLATGQLVR